MNTRIQRLQPYELKEFEPVMLLAREKVRELLARDGQLFRVAQDKVEVLREGQLATIDAYGRVTWQPHQA